MSALTHGEVEVAETPRLLSVREACRLLGLSRTTLYEKMSSGRLRSVTVGRRRLIPREAIDDFVAGLPADYRGSA